MKPRIRFSIVTLAVALLLTLGQVGSVSAQDPAYQTAFTTAITYQNVGDAAATIQLIFYPENSSSSITIDRPDLATGAGTSVSVGTLGDLGTSFTGTAILTSDQPVVATMVQLPSSTTVKNRPLSNGFSADDGSTSYLVPTVLKNKFNTTSIFSVQNVSSSAVDITLNFYDADNPANDPVVMSHSGLPAGAAKYYDLGNLSQLSDGFNGSVSISGTGNIVAAAQELSTTGTNASSFEGVSGGGSTVYMASALCNGYGTNSAYAIQNTSQTATASVTVEFTMKNISTQAVTTSSATATIAPGTKRSILGCNATDNPQGWTVSGGGNPDNTSGSAKITATGAEIVAIGKVSGGGRSTAFLGATEGAAELALPYIRWSNTKYDTGQYQKASIAIQNVGSSTVTGAKIEYRNKNGELVGTHNLDNIEPSGKANSNVTKVEDNTRIEVTEFGNPEANPGGGFGGGALIIAPSGSQLVATVRIASKVPAAGQVVAEDYNGIPTE